MSLKRHEKIALTAFIGLLILSLVPALYAQTQVKAPSIIDTSAPIPLWSLLTFLAVWGLSILGYRVQRRKDLSEIEKQKIEAHVALVKLITDTCHNYWLDDNVVLKLERKIGDIAERVAKSVKTKALEEGALVGSKDLDLLRKDLEILETKLKNTLLKEVIVLMSTKMVGGAKE